MRILHVEDSADDAELIIVALRRGGLGAQFGRVDTLEDLENALEEPWDLVLSDYCLPTFTAMDALRIVRTRRGDLPFLVISGTIGEETAVEAMRAGADDYLMKENLTRLAPAVLRGLREAAQRREKRRLAEQLAQASKLEALGQLAGGIAHDFNNILTVVQGFADFLLMKLEETDPEGHDDAREIVKAAERGAALTSQLLAFSRKQIVQPQLLDVNRILANLVNMLRRLIGENVKMELKLEPDLRPLIGDRNQLEQVIVNLSINARDAMEQGGGTLTIATENRPPDYVRLTVSDTGTGMDEETKGRLFEPFFTTKGPHKGTGLGLATVYGIVTQSEGAIQVHSELGKGTRFLIDLPVARPMPVEARPFHPLERPSPDLRQGRILLVEDEPMVARLLTRMLESNGFRVITTGSPIDAARIFAGSSDVQLLISDVGLPGKSGAALAQELVHLRPDLRVILISGYLDQPDEVKTAGFTMLEKPFSQEQLLEAVEQALRMPPPSS